MHGKHWITYLNYYYIKFITVLFKLVSRGFLFFTLFILAVFGSGILGCSGDQ